MAIDTAKNVKYFCTTISVKNSMMELKAIKEYISEVNNKYKEDNTTEHSFRGALETLLKTLTDLTVVNEAQHITCGAPVLTLL